MACSGLPASRCRHLVCMAVGHVPEGVSLQRGWGSPEKPAYLNVVLGLPKPAMAQGERGEFKSVLREELVVKTLQRVQIQGI